MGERDREREEDLLLDLEREGDLDAERDRDMGEEDLFLLAGRLLFLFESFPSALPDLDLEPDRDLDLDLDFERESDFLSSGDLDLEDGDFDRGPLLSSAFFGDGERDTLGSEFN